MQALAINTNGDLFAGNNQGVFRHEQPTAVNEFASEMPLSFELARNYPNPFNPSTMTKYELPQQVEVKLVIFDVLGRRVRTLVNQRQPAGRYTLTWDGRNEQGQVLASGVYIYQLPPVALCRHGAWRWCAESGSLE